MSLTAVWNAPGLFRTFTDVYPFYRKIGFLGMNDRCITASDLYPTVQVKSKARRGLT